MGDRTHAAQWYQRQARGCATELSYHYKLQGNDVAVSAADDSQAPVNIGADCGYRPRLRSDRPVFKAPLTPPPPDAAAATFAQWRWPVDVLQFFDGDQRAALQGPCGLVIQMVLCTLGLQATAE